MDCLCKYSSSEVPTSTPTVVRTKLRHGIERKVLHCEVCDFVFLEPQSADLQEYYREQYRKDYSPSVVREMSPRETFEMYRPYMVERIGRVGPHLLNDMTVLEIGCSTGHFLDALAPHVGERIGIEYNASHAAFVRNELGVPCYTAPIQESGIAQGSIDVIFMFHVFEHVEDPVSFLAGMRPYLSERGSVYIEVPNVDDALVSPYAISEYADFYYREPHISYFSPRSFNLTARLAGFSGEQEMIQRYSLMNHMHWVSARSPMKDAESGMATPTFADDESDFTLAVNQWLAKADDDYRELLKKHERAESMAFLGRPGL